VLLFNYNYHKLTNCQVKKLKLLQATIAQASETWLKADSTFKPTDSPAEGD